MSNVFLSSRFDLTRDEADFFDQHRTYDRYYVVTHLVNWLAVALYGYTPEERKAFVNACAQGTPPQGVPASVAALLVRYAPVAAVMGDFYREFQQVSRTAPHPLATMCRMGRSA
ncbi:hypothetical protein [Streptomyces bottropensis]|uniref:hypothetical protein n=1 Tax=Streptomyces bottropensis TaxID=42235 RepID=UPI003678A097